MPAQPELKLLCNKVGQYVKLASSEIEAQREENLELRKQASLASRKQHAYEQALPKVAKALYDADFITDDVERRRFLKKAAEDPSFLASVIVKVCNAADVALIGSPARVAVKQKQGEEFDPVKARAFGIDYTGHSGSLLEDLN